MNSSTRLDLNALNRRFYHHFAHRFDATRDHPWPGWHQLLDQLPASSAEGYLRILDVGCGNGRLATFFDQNSGLPFTYLGVDSCLSLLAAARQKTRSVPQARFAAGELVTGPLASVCRKPPGGEFDLITCFAVLHHLPGHTQRTELVTRLASHLRPGGILALSVWKFDQQPSFARKRLPWTEFQELQLANGDPGLDLVQLEPGDHLLTWDGNRKIPRYCHLPNDQELADWTRGLEVVGQYEADGSSGADNRYLLITHQPPVGPSSDV